MTETGSGDESLASALLQSAPNRNPMRETRARDRATMIDTLIAQRLVVDDQIRRIAVISWWAVVIFVLASAFFYYLSRTDMEQIAEAAEPAKFAFEVLVVLGTALSLIMTFAWLSRTRGPSPHVLEARLAAIESMLEDGP